MGNNQQLADQLLHKLVIRFLNRKCHNHLQSRKSLIQCWPPARKNQHQEDVLPFSNFQIQCSSSPSKELMLYVRQKIAGKPKIEACGS